jgi:two-component system, LytTR family, response regulator
MTDQQLNDFAERYAKAWCSKDPEKVAAFYAKNGAFGIICSHENLSQSRARAGEQRFAVRSGQTTSFISPNEIDWIEADGNYAILHVGKRNHLLRETMSALQTALPATSFARVSRSAIVHLDRVKEIRTGPNDQHFAILGDGREVPITRGVREITGRLRAAT